MGLSIEGKPDQATAIDVIHQALDAGCRHLDTAWSYYESGGPEQTNERLVRQALDSWKGPRQDVLVATKVGHYRNFLDLQRQLKDLEDKIAYARQFYNDVVQKFNTRIETVPSNIIASLFHFRQAQYFQADEGSRQAPVVDFGQ